MTAPSVLHLFAGAGGGALGFHRAGFRSLGAVDFNADACADLEILTGEPATCADLGTMTPAELRALTRGETPDVVFSSPPCKGFSGCLPNASAATPAYQAMNSLALRGVWLALEAWDRPPPLVVLENVPRILARGRQWIEQITGLLHGYGYAVATTVHDCGELGGLAQRRRRLLLVARHMEQVPAFLREPPRRRVLAVGDMLAQLPIPTPGSDAGGPMHALPRLSVKNWVRLALIRPGGDWRDLPKAVALPPHRDRHAGKLGVQDWADAGHTVIAKARPCNTWASVADPRVTCSPRAGTYGVQAWGAAGCTVIGHHRVDSAPGSIADPRVACSPRPESWGLQPWAEHAHTIRGVQRIQTTRASVDDPRPVTPSHVVRPGSPPAINGPTLDLGARRPTHLVIRAADGTWHRPLTTLELAVIQGFPAEVRGAPLVLAGRSHQAWRERIGNAVPPPTAEAIARECAACLARARAGTFALSSQPIWIAPEVRP